jgi:hypothetical protein
VAREEVVGALEGAYINGLLARDTQLFLDQMDYAKMVHKYYFSQQGRVTQVDPNSPRMAQMDADFSWVAGPVFAALVTRLELDDAETLYDQADNPLRQFAFDILREGYEAGLNELAKAGKGRPFDKVFPAPDGIEVFRAAAKDKREKLLKRPEVEQK